MTEGLPGAADLELLVTRAMPFGKHKGTIIADLPGNYLKIGRASCRERV